MSIFSRLRKGIGKGEDKSKSKSKSESKSKGLEGINKGFVNKLKKFAGVTEQSFRELAQEMEEELLLADFGILMTRKIMSQWRSNASHIKDKEAAMTELAKILENTLKLVEQPLLINTENKPYCLLIMGVNGSGKTTTLAKIAAYYQKKGFSLQLAAGDTYRAAATEQLQVWGERLNIPVTCGDMGLDSTAVIYRGLQQAIETGKDIYLADTAGRMPNNEELKQQLRKTVKAVSKLKEGAPDEILLTLDGSHGQSALMQARLFCEAVDVSAICVTKLDGGASGGVIFALAEELKLPIRFIGVGEDAEDLLDFNAADYVRELWS